MRLGRLTELKTCLWKESDSHRIGAVYLLGAQGETNHLNSFMLTPPLTCRSTTCLAYICTFGIYLFSANKLRNDYGRKKNISRDVNTWRPMDSLPINCSLKIIMLCQYYICDPAVFYSNILCYRMYRHWRLLSWSSEKKGIAIATSQAGTFWLQLRYVCCQRVLCGHK